MGTGSIAIDLVIGDESKISSTSTEKGDIAPFSWILSIWRSGGMSDVSYTTGDWDRMFLEKFLYRLKSAQEEVCMYLMHRQSLRIELTNDCFFCRGQQ